MEKRKPHSRGGALRGAWAARAAARAQCRVYPKLMERAGAAAATVAVAAVAAATATVTPPPSLPVLPDCSVAADTAVALSPAPPLPVLAG